MTSDAGAANLITGAGVAQEEEGAGATYLSIGGSATETVCVKASV